MYTNLCIFVISCFSFFSVSPRGIFGQATIDQANACHEPLSVFGNAKVTNASFEEVTVHGQLDAKRLTVGELLSVNGHIEADHLTATKLKCNGCCNLKKSTIKKSAFIRGCCHLIKTTVGKLKLQSEEGRFTDCTIDDLIVKPNKGWSWWTWLRSFFVSVEPEEQFVWLDGKTHITGNVLFEGGKGTVRAGKSVKIDGTVTGGHIVRE